MDNQYYETPFYSYIFVLLASYSSSSKQEERRVLQVSLEETSVSVKDLFTKVEVILLETNDSSLLAHIVRVCESNGNYYLFLKIIRHTIISH